MCMLCKDAEIPPLQSGCITYFSEDIVLTFSSRVRLKTPQDPQANGSFILFHNFHLPLCRTVLFGRLQWMQTTSTPRRPAAPNTTPFPVFFSISPRRGWLFLPRRRHNTPGPRSSACCSCTKQASRQQPQSKTTTAASARGTCRWDLLSTSPHGTAARSHSGSGLADCDTGNYGAENKKLGDSLEVSREAGQHQPSPRSLTRALQPALRPLLRAEPPGGTVTGTGTEAVTGTGAAIPRPPSSPSAGQRPKAWHVPFPSRHGEGTISEALLSLQKRVPHAARSAAAR